MMCLGCLGSKAFIVGAIFSVLACLCLIGLPAHPYAPYFEYELTVFNIKNTQKLSLTAMLTKSGTDDTKFTSLQDWCSEDSRSGVWKDFCNKKWIGGGLVAAGIICSIVSMLAACCQGCKMPVVVSGKTCCASTSAVFMILAFILSGAGIGVYAANKDDLTGYDFGWGFWAAIGASALACPVAVCLSVGAMQLRGLASGSGDDGEEEELDLPKGVEVVGSKGGGKDLMWV